MSVNETVGDAAAMREALLKVSSSLCPACRRRNCEDCPRSVADCEFVWAQMPYKEKGEPDGK